MILLTILLIIILFYGVSAIIYDIVEKPSVKTPLKLASMIVSIFGLILISLIVKIGPQDVGVVTTPQGIKSTELHTGWHIVPWWHDVHRMDKTVWVYTCTQENKKTQSSDAIWVPTKDGIKIGFDVSVSWKINPDEASWVYANISENDGTDGRYYWLEENVIRTKLKSALALSVSTYTPIEAYSAKRENIQKDVFNRMKQEILPFKLIVEQVDLREVFYNADYEKAINAKKLAEQEVLKLVEVTKQQEEKLKQAEINKNIAIQQAEGEAKALQIKGNSIAANPKIIELQWIEKWNGHLPTYMMGNGQGVILNLPNSR